MNPMRGGESHALCSPIRSRLHLTLLPIPLSPIHSDAFPHLHLHIFPLVNIMISVLDILGCATSTTRGQVLRIRAVIGATASRGRKESLVGLDTASRSPSNRPLLDSIDGGASNRTSNSLNPVKSVKSVEERSEGIRIFCLGNREALLPHR